MSMRSPSLAGFFCVALFVTPAAAGCNFFEALFGCSETTTAPQAQAGRDFHRAGKARHFRHREMSPQAAADENHVGGDRKQMAMKPRVGEKAGSLAVFKRDPTLRAGDIVATNEGFFEYRGAGAFRAIEPHRKGMDLRLASAE